MKPRSHVIDIPTIFSIERGARHDVARLLKREGLNRVAIFFDKAMKVIYGADLEVSLRSEGIRFHSYCMDTLDYAQIANYSFSLPSDVEVILALGGGKTIDGAKYIAFIKKLPFISVPTSSSNDGFSSPVASLIVNGHRTTVPAAGPYGIIIDLDIIANAPAMFIYSGIGDLMSKITALWDWKFESQHIDVPYDDFAVMIAQKAVNSFVSLSSFDFKDSHFLSEFLYSLCMNGIAMEICGSSAPASGSEHLISHAMDKISKTPYLHGMQVGISTYLVSLLQKNQTDDINRVYDTIGFWREVKALKIPRQLVHEAIDIAPSIKPQRHTILHEKEYREQAQALLITDKILKEVLVD